MSDYETYRPVLESGDVRIGVVLANNPSHMTLGGTNSWIVRGVNEQGVANTSAIVIDPGPDDGAHLQAVLDAAGGVAAILLTHHHPDHAAGAATFQQWTSAPVFAMDTARQPGSDPLRTGQAIDAAGVTLQILATPGHTTDSVCFIAESTDGPCAVFTGDTILGSGTTVVAHPDGVLADYLDSLERLAELQPMAALPGHGPERSDIGAAAKFYLEHRRQRLDQVRAALDVGGPDQTARQIVEVVYADIDPLLWDAAEQSVRAQLAYLHRS